MAKAEFELIDWIRAHTARHSRLTTGIGDDAAVFRFPRATDALITVDMLMEGTDFLFESTPRPSTLPAGVPIATPRQVGHKSLAVNLSDIAAMGGNPVAAVVSVALPHRGGESLAKELHTGLRELAERFDVALAGGDTNSWDGPLVISVTVVGEPTARGPVLRSGAQPGDWIFVTGELGGSLWGRHLTFTPRVNEARLLVETVPVHAMIDISDGLAADLRHILDESRASAILEEIAIPVSADARRHPDGKRDIEHALGDGEDFELIFTVSSEDGATLLRGAPFSAPKLTKIGEIGSGPSGHLEIRTARGELLSVDRSGWRHEFS